jgi:parallel beta-helix repeat protein
MNLVKLATCLSFLYFISFSIVSKEYWLAPPKTAVEECLTDICLCKKSNPCNLNDVLLKQLQPGDFVYFSYGNYPAFIIQNIHGTSSKPIVFSGDLINEKAKISVITKGNIDHLEIKHSSHIKVTGFDVQNARRAGIRVNNSHYINIANNRLSNNGVWGIFTNHSNHFIAENNIIIGPAQQHGIYHSNSGDHVEISANYIQGFNGCGIHMNGDLSMGGAWEIPGDGIISNVVITDNYIADNGLSGGSAINLDGVVQATIDNNISINNKAAALSIFKADGAVGSSQISVTNNLMLMAKRSRWAINIKNSGGANTFVNNMIISQNSYRGIYDIVSKNKKTINMLLAARKNIYGFGRHLAVLNDDKHFSFTDWQKRYQIDQDSSQAPYKHILSKHNKLSEPLAELVTKNNIASSNPFLYLLF